MHLGASVNCIQRFKNNDRARLQFVWLPKYVLDRTLRLTEKQRHGNERSGKDCEKLPNVWEHHRSPKSRCQVNLATISLADSAFERSQSAFSAGRSLERPSNHPVRV